MLDLQCPASILCFIAHLQVNKKKIDATKIDLATEQQIVSAIAPIIQPNISKKVLFLMMIFISDQSVAGQISTAPLRPDGTVNLASVMACRRNNETKCCLFRP